MKQLVRKVVLSTVITSFSLLFVQSSFAQSNISDYLLEPMPNWYVEGYQRGHLDINKMVKDGYSRLEAVEIQNQMKDILENDPDYTKLDFEGKTYDMVKNKDSWVLKALNTAIKNVKEKKQFESGFVPEPLKDNEFYVAFDLDETILVQWYESGQKGTAYYDGKVTQLDNFGRPPVIGPGYFVLIPGLEKAFKEISEIPGNKGIIIFSAKLDTASNDIIDKIKYNGKPVRQFLKGVFSRNFLVREQEPTKLSKDLRIIDESLKHVILIDDNPYRTLEKQSKNIREFPKYGADEYLTAKNITKDKEILKYYENLLPTVISELKEAEEYSQKNKVSFVDAYYPYSTNAQTELIYFIKLGYSMKDAVNMVRKYRNLIEPKFFIPPAKK